ncbi:hypothetical protein Y1Q_0004998 [Alligator mississippiensis]|uniref:Uncharacterized protein n=1 Tax=Alligator mississippiensis TaxID=8496 RepID=A0A151PKA1_ALLMI|nr:hypothetical protein Y1Q_0004998 [Alligator mississippiensis]
MAEGDLGCLCGKRGWFACAVNMTTSEGNRIPRKEQLQEVPWQAPKHLERRDESPRKMQMKYLGSNGSLLSMTGAA